MKYFYKCENCKSTKQIECLMSEFKKEIKCERCNGKMTQDFLRKKLSFTIPCTFNDETYSPRKDYNIGSSDLEEMGY